jgi:two-component system, OmpR family, sensor kinase
MRSVLDRAPLRIKLVAAVLLLVTAALLVIGVASTFALRSYLVNRMDSELRETAATLVNVNTETYMHPYSSTQVNLPTNYFVQKVGPTGLFMPAYDAHRYGETDLPVVPQNEEAARSRVNHPFTAPATAGYHRWRVLVTATAQPGYIMVAEEMSDVDNAVRRLVVSELLVGLGVLILLGVAGAGVVRASLRPLTEIENTAAAIAAGDLTKRVPDLEPGEAEPRTEVGRLGRALNTMLGQIETAFTARAASESAARAAESAARDAADAAQVSEARARRSEERMRQFVADASHELRTPLTTIRGFAELYRQGAVRTPEEIERLVRRIEEEASRMGLLVEDLLLLARLDQERPLERTPLEVRVIANDAVTAARAVAPDREISLEIAPGTGPLVVSADESRLRQVVDNLMSNALAHTPAGTPVWLRLAAAEGDVVIEIADSGPGLSAEQAERVFERFYRADTARTRRAAPHRQTSGTGLGLAIVAALVAAHDGTVEVETAPGEGATFRVRLPAVPEPAVIPS